MENGVKKFLFLLYYFFTSFAIKHFDEILLQSFGWYAMMKLYKRKGL